MVEIGFDDEEMELLVDGERLQALGYSESPEGLEVLLERPSDIEHFISQSFQEVADSLVRVAFSLKPDWSNEEIGVEVGFQPHSLKEFDWPSGAVEGQMMMTFQFKIDYANWARPWSIAEYGAAMEEVIKSRDLPLQYFETQVHIYSPFIFLCSVRDQKSTLQEELDYWFELLHSVKNEATASLASSVDRDTLVTLFQFPESIQTACEQYLLYFVQFLRDLGIEAEADVRHEASKMLFSVTPEEGHEALDQIREALEVYLQIPGAPDFEVDPSSMDEIAVRQLQANVHHLKGQLAIASATLEAKNATIEVLKLSNYRYRQLLADADQAKQIDIGTVQESPSSEDEPILEGIVEITEYEGKGFTINLPEILRKLKRVWGK